MIESNFYKHKNFPSGERPWETPTSQSTCQQFQGQKKKISSKKDMRSLLQHAEIYIP